MTLLVWSVGDLQPSISDTITVSGSPFNLSSSTVVFKMREVGSSVLKVNADAVAVSPKTDGVVRYDWTSADVDTAGVYLVWWEVTTAGSVQSVGEQLIEFRTHAPTVLPGYVEMEELKRSLSLSGQSYADLDIEYAVSAASRAVDGYCGRQFYKDSTTSARYFDARTPDLVLVDDVISINEVAIDYTGQGNYTTIWDTTDYNPGPYNNPVKGWPYEWLRRNWMNTLYLPVWIPKCVRVEAQFGWSDVPGPIKTATAMLAHRLVRRQREAPFAIMTVGMESARAVKIEQSDPDVGAMLANYVKTAPFA